MTSPIDYATPAADSTYRRSIYFCALLVTISVFPLIWMGGLVTSHGAGMSVPDWPNSYGYNMFLFPPSKMVGGIFYEHTHRLLGTLSGFLSVALVFLAWGPARRESTRYRIGVFTVAMFLLTVACIGTKLYLAQSTHLSDEFKKSFSHIYVLFGSLGLFGLVAWFCRQRDGRRWFRWLTIVQLIAIIIQGTLGGLRVTEVNTELAIVHGCFAQAFFCLTGFVALATSRWWYGARDLSREPDAPAGRTAIGIATMVMVAIFAQLLVGATMRHKDAALAIPDLPLAFGKLLPPTNSADLDRANQIRVWQYHLPEATYLKMWLHFGHRAGAILVTLAIAVLAFQVFRRLKGRHGPALIATVLCVLVSVQFTLGVLTIYLKRPPDIASLHVAIGAIIFLSGALAVGMLSRQYVRRGAVQPVGQPADGGIGRLATV